MVQIVVQIGFKLGRTKLRWFKLGRSDPIITISTLHYLEFRVTPRAQQNRGASDVIVPELLEFFYSVTTLAVFTPPYFLSAKSACIRSETVYYCLVLAVFADVSIVAYVADFIFPVKKLVPAEFAMLFRIGIALHTFRQVRLIFFVAVFFKLVAAFGAYKIIATPPALFTGIHDIFSINHFLAFFKSSSHGSFCVSSNLSTGPTCPAPI